MLRNIFKIVGIVILTIIGYFFIKGFIIKNEFTNFIYIGSSGIKKQKPFRIYFYESMKYDLSGIDGQYVLYKQDTIFSISVDNQNRIEQKHYNVLEKIEVQSANSQKKFNVNILKNKNIENSIYETKENIFVISDIEGDFDKFHQILLRNNIINSDLEWNFGKGHLVLLGDYFDRGEDVTAVLWLCYKLEQESEKQGGAVHFILGNHEQMNIQGSVKYVQDKYQAIAQKLNIPYKELYGKNSELGRWLRTKNAIIKINNILFTHGGISPNFIKLRETIDITNQKILKAVDIPLKDMYSTTGKDIGNPFYKYINIESPLWYRGYFSDWGNYKKATQTEVEVVCKYYGVNKIIVGHTIVDEIKNHYEGRVIGINVKREYNNKKNQKPSALLIENYQYYAVDEHGRKFPVK